MAITTQDNNGQQYVKQGGTWRAATPDEVELLSMGPREVAFKSAMLQAAGLKDLFVSGFEAFGPGGVNQRSRTAFEQSMQSFAENEAMRVVRPEPVMAGERLLEIPLWLAGLGSASKARPGSMASRVGSKIAAEVGDQTDDVARRSMPGFAPTFGQTSAGAAQVGGTKVEPSTAGKFLRFVNRALDEPRALSADQFDIIDSGLYKNTGFVFPKAWMLGKNMYGMFNSNALLYPAIARDLASNARTLGVKAIRGLGLDPADFQRGFSRGVVGRARKTIGGRFNAVRESFDGVGDISEIADDVAKYLRADVRRIYDRKGWDALDGGDLFSIRSRLNKRISQAWKLGEDVLGEDIQRLVDQLDDIIRSNPGVNAADWDDARELWRTFMAFERPGVIDVESGEVSLKGLVNALGKQYRDFAELGPTELKDIPLRLQETRELLEYARVARSFVDALPDSGTASRSAANLSKQDVARTFGLRWMLDELPDDPQKALQMGIIE